MEGECIPGKRTRNKKERGPNVRREIIAVQIQTGSVRHFQKPGVVFPEISFMDPTSDCHVLITDCRHYALALTWSNEGNHR